MILKAIFYLFNPKFVHGTWTHNALKLAFFSDGDFWEVKREYYIANVLPLQWVRLTKTVYTALLGFIELVFYVFQVA